MQFLLIISSEFLKFIIMLNYIQEDCHGLFLLWNNVWKIWKISWLFSVMVFEKLVDYLLLWFVNFMFDPQFWSIS